MSICLKLLAVAIFLFVFVCDLTHEFSFAWHFSLMFIVSLLFGEKPPIEAFLDALGNLFKSRS